MVVRFRVRWERSCVCVDILLVSGRTLLPFGSSQHVIEITKTMKFMRVFIQRDSIAMRLLHGYRTIKSIYKTK